MKSMWSLKCPVLSESLFFDV